MQIYCANGTTETPAFSDNPALLNLPRCRDEMEARLVFKADWSVSHAESKSSQCDKQDYPGYDYENCAHFGPWVEDIVTVVG